MSSASGYVSLVFKKGTGETLQTVSINGFKTNDSALSIHEIVTNDLFKSEMSAQPFDLGYEYTYAELNAEFVTRQSFTVGVVIDNGVTTDLTA